MGELCSALGSVMGRPSLVPVPDFALRTLLGEVRLQRRGMQRHGSWATARVEGGVGDTSWAADNSGNSLGLLSLACSVASPACTLLPTAGRVGGAGGAARGAHPCTGRWLQVQVHAGGLRGCCMAC